MMIDACFSVLLTVKSLFLLLFPVLLISVRSCDFTWRAPAPIQIDDVAGSRRLVIHSSAPIAICVMFSSLFIDKLRYAYIFSENARQRCHRDGILSTHAMGSAQHASKITFQLKTFFQNGTDCRISFAMFTSPIERSMLALCIRSCVTIDELQKETFRPIKDDTSSAN